MSFCELLVNVFTKRGLVTSRSPNAQALSLTKILCFVGNRVNKNTFLSTLNHSMFRTARFATKLPCQVLIDNIK